MKDSSLVIYLFGFAFSFLATVMIEKRLIPRLSGIAKQPIYEEGPSWHLKKQGTPTMGGLAFFISSIIALLISSVYFSLSGEGYLSSSVLICTVYAALSSLIGMADDLTKLRRRKNGGLTASQKLFFQSLAAALFLLLRYFILSDKPILYFSFGAFNIGPIYYILSFIMLVGTVNCANLTDGIDGLASGVAFAIGVALFYMSFSVSPDTATLAAVLIGISLGFLMFNLHPARIFMGDTGSLFFGAIVGSAAITLGNPLIVLIVGAVYVTEGLSVIIQVAYYKLTKKRIFLMAPLHHHLEKRGFSENKIVLSFMFVTFIMAIISYIIFL